MSFWLDNWGCGDCQYHDDLDALDKPFGKVEWAVEKVQENMFYLDFEF